MGQKNGPYSTGDDINEGFFLQENVWPFCQAAKKSGHDNKVIVLPSGSYPKQNCNVYCTCGFTLKTCFLFSVPCGLYTVYVVHVKGVLMVKVLNLLIYH